MEEPPEFRELAELANAEFGKFDQNSVAVYMVRIGRASGKSQTELLAMPLNEVIEWIKKTTPPPGLFGAPNTMGELMKLLEIEQGHCETSPELLAHARNRLVAIRSTSDYQRLVKLCKTLGLNTYTPKLRK